MINYWYLTGDTAYNDITQQAMLHQASDTEDYMPPNQTSTEGNDDQAFWGMAAMMAAETKFQDPPHSQPGWLALAQGVFNIQAARWDDTTCNGGLRWQIFTWNKGYNYKNSISNGCFFNLAARLALYTGDARYADWAIKTWDWVYDIGLISPDFQIFDGTQNYDNCTTQDKTRWTYNAGVFLLGSAAMYNHVSHTPNLLPCAYIRFWNQTNGSALWRERTMGILNASEVFFINDTMYEPCEGSPKGCNVDQRSFKAYFARWLSDTAELAPFTHDIIMPKLAKAASAAIKICTGGSSGRECGQKWTTGQNDGSFGVGEQMAVLEVVQGNLRDGAPGWVSEVQGTGSSRGSTNDPGTSVITPVTVADRIGAGILTALILAGVIGGTVAMILP
jgi:mannan endo-1,6-alpha-mannosidase